MGRDKALLRWNGVALVESIAARVAAAAGSATVIGPPDSYGPLGLTVIPDLLPGLGPLGGLYTALRTTPAEWNLLVACDLPLIEAATLRRILEDAIGGDARAIVPQTAPGQLEPLCAVYHCGLLPEVEAAIHANNLKMHDFVSSIGARLWPVASPREFANMNRPFDWETLQRFPSEHVKDWVQKG